MNQVSFTPRRQSRQVWVGPVPVGGDAPVSVQSMTNTDTRDVAATLAQIRELADAGCEIVRLAVPDTEAADALPEIVRQTAMPVVADIHFDYQLALAALQAGVAGLRINPGNIGARERVLEVAAAAKDRHVPIRIGVNAGSLEKSILEKYSGPTPQGMVESALNHIKILEDCAFELIKISLKASHVPMMLAAYRELARQVNYPFHLGVTEAGTNFAGTIKSAIGIGALLAEGIGDTIRVSLTAPPRDEIRVGYEILKALGLRQRGPEIISCPTCGRCQVNLIQIARQVEEAVQHISQPLKIAVMGCVVNGPGEAREADLGVAGGKGVGLLFKNGEVLRKVPEEHLVAELLQEVNAMIKESGVRIRER